MRCRLLQLLQLCLDRHGFNVAGVRDDLWCLFECALVVNEKLTSLTGAAGSGDTWLGSGIGVILGDSVS